MSKVFSEEIKSNHIEFTWGDETLAFREASQTEIDSIGQLTADEMHEQAKNQLNLRISGSSKDKFLKEWYDKKSAISLLSMLNSSLAKEAMGK